RPSHRLLTLPIGRIPQRRDRVRLRAQPLEVVHEPVARVLRVLVVHAHVDRFLGANLLTVPTEHAAELVDLVDQWIPVALLVLSGHELDTVRRADLGAQAARDALGAPLLIGEHAMRAAPPRRERPVLAALFLRILHRHFGPPQVAQGERHALERSAQVGDFGPRPLHHFHADRHQTPPAPSSAATEPAMMWPRSSTKNRSTASSRLSPNKARAKRVSYGQPSRSCRNQIAVAITVR